MANNISIGDNFVTAKQTAAFSSFLTDTDTLVIYGKNDAGVTSSWKPGRTINGITGTLTDTNYLLKSKQAKDFTAYFSPPFTGGGGGSTLPFTLA